MGDFIAIAKINTALHDSLRVCDDDLAKFSKNYDNLPEGIVNTPLLISYWSSKNTGESTDRATFRGGIRITDLIFNVDLYLDQRAHTDKIFPQMFVLIDKIDSVLEAQNTKPYFGLQNEAGDNIIKSYHYSAAYATFEFEGNDGNAHKYPGVRWTIDIRLF